MPSYLLSPNGLEGEFLKALIAFTLANKTSDTWNRAVIEWIGERIMEYETQKAK